MTYWIPVLIQINVQGATRRQTIERMWVGEDASFPCGIPSTVVDFLQRGRRRDSLVPCAPALKDFPSMHWMWLRVSKKVSVLSVLQKLDKCDLSLMGRSDINSYEAWRWMESTILDVMWYDMIWYDKGHFIFVGFLPVTHKLRLIMRKTDKLQPRDHLQNTWSALLKTVQVLKNRGSLRNCHSQEETWRRLSVPWNSGRDIR
jgi:hypothetical protein